MARRLNHEDTKTLSETAGGKTLAQLARGLLDACDPDFIETKAREGKSATYEPSPSELSVLRASVVKNACAPFDKPALRATLETLKQETEQALDIYTPDEVVSQGFDAAAKAKAAGLVQAFCDYLVRFALEKQPVLEPCADSVAERFDSWLEQKATSGISFTADQRAWLELMRDQIATTCSNEPDDFDYAPFSQRGGLGKAHQIFGEQLPKLLEELNTTLAP